MGNVGAMRRLLMIDDDEKLVTLIRDYLKSHGFEVAAAHDGADGRYITALVGDAQQPSPWTQTYIDANPEIIKARRRADMEPEWRFRRPVAVNVDNDDRIIVLESYRHRLQIYNKLKDYEEHSLNL